MLVKGPVKQESSAKLMEDILRAKARKSWTLKYNTIQGSAQQKLGTGISKTTATPTPISGGQKRGRNACVRLNWANIVHAACGVELSQFSPPCIIPGQNGA